MKNKMISEKNNYNKYSTFYSKLKVQKYIPMRFIVSSYSQIEIIIMKLITC